MTFARASGARRLHRLLRGALCTPLGKRMLIDEPEAVAPMLGTELARLAKFHDFLGRNAESARRSAEIHQLLGLLLLWPRLASMYCGDWRGGTHGRVSARRRGFQTFGVTRGVSQFRLATRRAEHFQKRRQDTRLDGTIEGVS